MNDAGDRSIEKQPGGAGVRHCVGCQRPLVSRYVVDPGGRTFCSAHLVDYAPCTFCGRLVPPQERFAPNTCGICFGTAIRTRWEGRPIAARLIQWMERTGLGFQGHPLELELAAPANLDAWSQSRGLAHVVAVTFIGPGPEKKVEGIVVAAGLPRAYFEECIVHELTHAWLALEDVGRLEPWAVEGFCEYMAARYHADHPSHESTIYIRRMERNPDAVYGGGFRQVRSIVQTVGFDRVLNSLRQNKRLVG